MSVLNANINVTDRPTTQQGLGGLKTGKKGELKKFVGYCETNPDVVVFKTLV